MFVRWNHYPCILLRFVAGSAERIAVLGFALTVQLFSCHFHDPLRSICVSHHSSVVSFHPAVPCGVYPCPLEFTGHQISVYDIVHICLMPEIQFY